MIRRWLVAGIEGRRSKKRALRAFLQALPALDCRLEYLGISWSRTNPKTKIKEWDNDK